MLPIGGSLARVPHQRGPRLSFRGQSAAMTSRRAAALLCASLPVIAAALTAVAPVMRVDAAAALANSSVFSLASFGGRIYAGTDDGLYVLRSGSHTWDAVGGPLGGREVNALAVSGGWLVAGTENGAVRSRDGATWVAGGLSGQRVASLSASGATLLAGTGHDQPGDGVVERSDDSGATWTSVTLPALVGLPGEEVQAVMVPDAGAPAWAGTAGGGALHSSDGKGQWAGTSGMKTSWVTAFWRDSSGRVLAGSDDGLYTWVGSAWTAVSFPESDPWIQALGTAAGGGVVAGTYNGTVYTQGAGGAWTLRASMSDSVYSLLAVSGGGLLVGTANGVDCISCPATIAAAAASPPGRSGAAPSLPPPGSRAGTSARAAGTTSSTSTLPSPGATALGAGAVAPPASGGSGVGLGGVLRWVLGGLLVLLGAAGLLLRRVRASGPP